MHWLLVRPAIGWAAFVVVHAIAIPVVYAMGKACQKNECEQKMLSEVPGSNFDE